MREQKQIHHEIFSIAAKEPRKISIEEARMEKENEILDMGGDPFFLTDEDIFDENIEEEEDVSMPSMSLLGVSGISGVISEQLGDDEGGMNEEVEEDPAFLWDGEVDESAYFDYE